MKFAISFKRLECLRCHGPRLVGLPCAACGLKPDEREFDPHRQRRRLLAQRGREVLERQPSIGAAVDHTYIFEVWGPLGSWLGDFLHALSHAEGTASDTDAIVEKIRELRDIADVVAGARR